MSVIIAIGLVVMPSIFTWYNVIACWNVFDNTGNLTVAVASVDEGYESDLIPLRVNIGEQVVSALRANEEIDWTFTTEEDAVDGARSGRYYAAVVIPEGFGRDMLTFYSEDVQHARIVCDSNEKKSAIAPKITDQGADTVSYQVSKVFVETLSEISAETSAKSLSEYADEADMDGRIAAVAGHVRSMGDDVGRMASVLGLYASLADTSRSLVCDSAKLIDSAQREVDGLGATASQGGSSASDMASALEESAEELSRALEASSRGFSAVSGSVDELFDVASTGAQESAAGMRDEADALDGHIAQYQSIVGELDPDAREHSPGVRRGARRRHLEDERADSAGRGHARQPAHGRRQVGVGQRRRAGRARRGQGPRRPGALERRRIEEQLRCPI